MDHIQATNRSSATPSSLSLTSTETSHILDIVYASAFERHETAVNGLSSLSFHRVDEHQDFSVDTDSNVLPKQHPQGTTYRSSATRPLQIQNSSSTSTQSDAYFDMCYQQFSRTAHMGILDPSYQVFTSQHGYGCLIYKTKNGIAVVAGDPLCSPEHYQPLLDEFQHSRGNRSRKLVYNGASASFAEFSAGKGSVVLHFGRERVCNPVTSPLLRNKAGKRTISQCRQLIDPRRGATSVYIYAPSIDKRHPQLERSAQAIYDEWRSSRNAARPSSAQAFITQYDLFSNPNITIFLFTRSNDGTVTGVAALRYLGANCGFQLDPCIAAVNAQRGITDLLVISAMQLLRNSGVTYLSLGFEPYTELRDVTGGNKLLVTLTREVFKRAMDAINVSGKQKYHDRLRPDDTQQSGLYIVLPRGLLHLRDIVAVLRAANVNITSLVH